MCMCLARGGVGVKEGERIGFGLYQSCGNRASVGRVFWLRWCRWIVGLDQGLDGWTWCKSTQTSRKAPNCRHWCSASTFLTCRDRKNWSSASAMLMT